MSPFLEHSAGVIPYRVEADGSLSYLILHSATVRNPRARWEFPKGGMEPGETPKQTASREFEEETSLVEWAFREGFERSLSYTYVRRGRKVLKTVTYYIVEVYDGSSLKRSHEHAEDPHGHWHKWGTFEEVTNTLYHAKIRQLFAEADAWIRGVELPTIGVEENSGGETVGSSGTSTPPESEDQGGLDP
jgi:8-oxo-dGTP pyrophosphatase MutT (NUDIX family)